MKSRLKWIHDADTHASSALDKIHLAKQCPRVMKTITRKFGSDIEFVKAVERLTNSYQPFDDGFASVFESVQEIALTEAVASNLGLFSETGDHRYKENLESLKGEIELPKLGVSSLTEIAPNAVLRQSSEKLIAGIYRRLAAEFDALPSEQDAPLSTRLQKEAKLRARNIATRFVCNTNLTSISMVYVDLSGLRDIHGEMEDVVSRYYHVVTDSLRKRTCKRLYGGDGGDDAFVVLFADIRAALQFALDVKKQFGGDMFLRAQPERDVKFGLSCVEVTANEPEKTVVRAWGTAKDCCEFKDVGFSNRGNLIVCEETMDFIRTRCDPSILSQFVPIEGQRLKHHNQSQIFKFVHIEPFSPA